MINTTLSATDLSQLTEDEALSLRTTCTHHTIRLMDKMASDNDVLNQDCVVVHNDDDSDDDYNDQGDDLEMLLSTYTLNSCLQSRLCFIIFYLCTVLLLIASTVAMVVVLVMIVTPYHKVTGFVQTTCIVVDVSWYAERKQCSCGKGCTSDYPCLLISVSSSDEPNNTALLYEHESMLNEKCSFSPRCTSSRASNEQTVTRYAHEYGSQHTNFTCLINPSNPKEVIRRRRFMTSYVIHAILWPAAAIFLLISMCVLHLVKRGCGTRRVLYK